MTRIYLLVSLSCAFALASTASGLAQEKRAKTAGEIAAGTWAWGDSLSYVRDHFVKAAEEFPEDKYNYRPTEDARSFAEIVMHIARSNHLIAARDSGKEQEDVSAFAFHSKAGAIAKLKKSFQELEEALKQKPESSSVPSELIHVSEHYGNLATYYRLNGLVPPASR
jgi:DinB superfamily